MPGWNALVDLVRSGLEFFIDVTGNAGLGIIVFTILVKLLLVPLTLPALRNSRKQQELSPLIREIQKKHKGDRAAATAEQMELYKQYGFNPLSGCLPMLVQLPIFLALWNAISKLSTTAGSTSFLWIDNITAADPYHILPFLAAGAQFIQTRMSMQPRKNVVDAQQRQMNMMLQFMPLLVIVFGWSIAAGAVLYWFVSSVFSATQQFFITGWGSLTELLPFLPQREPKKLLPPPNPTGYSKGSGKAGYMQRFQEKMLEAQKQQAQAKAGAKPAGSPAQAVVPVETAEVVAPEALSSDSVKLTQDAWQLPGAPGSTGTAAFAAGSAAGGMQANGNGASQATRRNPSGAQRPTNGNRRRKRK